MDHRTKNDSDKTQEIRMPDSMFYIAFQDIFKNSKFWAKFDLLTPLLAIKQIFDKAISMPV